MIKCALTNCVPRCKFALPAWKLPGTKAAASFSLAANRGFSLRLLCLLAFVPMGNVLAQAEAQPAPSEGGEQQSAQAMIRAFILPADGSNESVQVVILPQEADAGTAPQVIAATGGAPVFEAGYRPLVPGAVTVELRAGDKVLAKKAGTLRPARAYTFVAWQAPPATDWQIKAFPDDLSNPNAADRAIRILNFPAGREALLSIDRAAETKLPGNAVEELRAPPKVIGATVRVLDPAGGPPALSNLEMDFTIAKSGYIVVVPDNLGRMRPQFIVGGYEEIPELAPASATASAALSPEDAKRQRIAGAQQELDHQQAILSMIKAREAAMGDSANATLRENKLEAEKRLAELKKDLEAARSAAPPPAAP